MSFVKSVWDELKEGAGPCTTKCVYSAAVELGPMLAIGLAGSSTNELAAPSRMVHLHLTSWVAYLSESP
jgi:hypothetical protein